MGAREALEATERNYYHDLISSVQDPWSVNYHFWFSFFWVLLKLKILEKKSLPRVGIDIK